MSNRLEVNYSNKENHKDSHYLPAVHLDMLHSDILQPGSTQENSPIDTVSRDRKNRRARILFFAVASAALMVVLIYQLINRKEALATTVQTISEQAEQTIIVSADTLDSRAINPLLTEEAVNNGCIIITGTFRNQQNANTMLSNIRSNGYPAYQSSNDSLVRVGLQFDCIDIDLDSMLLVVRQTLSDRAWYLVPLYEPEL